MKNFTLISTFLAALLFLGACATSNDVVSNRMISKRKYNRGFHIDLKKPQRSSKETLANDSELNNKELVRQEKQVEQVKATANEETYAIIPTQASTKSSPVLAKEEALVTREGKQEVTKGVVTEKKTTNTTATFETVQQESYKKELKRTAKEELKKSKKSPLPVPADMFLIACIILAILIPPLAVLIYTNIDWMKVLIALLLWLLVLPGIIYALLVVLDIL